MQLGSKKSKIPTKTINVLKLKLRKESVSLPLTDSQWNEVINDSKKMDENLAEIQIESHLHSTETDKQKAKRIFLKKVWNKNIPFAEERKSNFQKFKNQLLLAEQVDIQ